MTRFLSIKALVLVSAVGASTWALHTPRNAPKQDSSPACQTQSAPRPDAHMVPADMIDGAKHPELISDVVAYRLFFLTVAEPGRIDQRSPGRCDRFRNRKAL